MIIQFIIVEMGFELRLEDDLKWMDWLVGNAGKIDEDFEWFHLASNLHFSDVSSFNLTVHPLIRQSRHSRIHNHSQRFQTVNDSKNGHFLVATLQSPRLAIQINEPNRAETRQNRS
jgi:hypothetical protein